MATTTITYLRAADLFAVAGERDDRTASESHGRFLAGDAAAKAGGDHRAACETDWAVTEPPREAWLARIPANDEKPEDGQFYARDDKGEGTLFYNRTLAAAADEVFLKIYAGEKLVKTGTAKPGADKSYAFAVKLKPGLIKYRVEFGTGDTVLHTARNLVCGDAFLLNGQSTALSRPVAATTRRKATQKSRGSSARSWSATITGRSSLFPSRRRISCAPASPGARRKRSPSSSISPCSAPPWWC